MQKKQLFGAGGPYIVFALCLVAAGVLGYQFFAPADTLVPEEPVLTEQEETLPPLPVIEQEEIEEEPTAEVAVVEEVEIPVAAVKPVEPQPKTPDIRSPLSGKTIAAFSADVLFYNETLEDWRTHNGVDIAAEEGTPVCAACDGTVLSVTEDALMGVTVVLEHEGGFTSTYACLGEEVYVSAGDEVLAGENIGAVGATASAESPEPHLHFSVSRDGKLIDPSVYLE